MPASLVEPDSLLTVDIGTVSTRAAFFDVVEGCYRFIASGHAPTTAAAPFKDLSEGVRQAIENLQIITGRTFLDDDHRLIMPSKASQGIDSFTATISAGPAITTVVVGLLNEISLESTHNLARTLYTRVVDEIGLNDTRLPEQQMDDLLRLQPELILVAGGTNGGASRTVQHLVETISLACYLMPVEKRPAVLFAGNQELADKVKSTLQSFTSALSVSPNLRPGIDTQDLQPAQADLARLYVQIRRGQMNGVDELNSWSGITLLPTAHAVGRVIRFLSQAYDSNKGILGVDLGASAATIAAAFGGELTLGVYPQLGLGEGLPGLLQFTSLDEILKWIPIDITAEAVRDYVFQKSLHPATLPATPEDLAVEQALARQSLAAALKCAAKDFSSRARSPFPKLTPYFDPILAAGSVITRAPTLGQSLLLLLDAVQPVGITNVILDQNNLLPALGVAASRNATLPVHVLESGAFLGLATLVAPFSNTHTGAVILKGSLLDQNGNETRFEVKQGALEALPLAPGQSGKLFLKPSHLTDIGFGPGRTRSNGIPVSGTVMGVVIDARGRPVRIPADAARRCEVLKKWLWTLGG